MMMLSEGEAAASLKLRLRALTSEMDSLLDPETTRPTVGWMWARLLQYLPVAHTQQSLAVPGGNFSQQVRDYCLRVRAQLIGHL